MPGRWTNWKHLDGGYSHLKDSYGIYEISIVGEDSFPIPVGRIGGKDPDGVLYIGRSGFSTARSRRDLSKRLQEFLSGAHSGGETLDQMVRRLRRRLGKFQLQYRVMRLDDEDIEAQEKQQIRSYFRKYCEPPPCNSAIPGKWELSS